MLTKRSLPSVWKANLHHSHSPAALSAYCAIGEHLRPMVFTRPRLAGDKRRMRLALKNVAEYRYREERISNYGSPIELRKGFYLPYLRSIHCS